jgi:hypothetical protein
MRYYKHSEDIERMSLCGYPLLVDIAGFRGTLPQWLSLENSKSLAELQNSLVDLSVLLRLMFHKMFHRTTRRQWRKLLAYMM